MTTATISYCGVVLSCSYEYQPAEPRTWEEPGCPAIAELSSVQIGGVEVLDLLSIEQREAVEMLLIEAREQADGDAMYEKRRDEKDYA